MPGRTAEPPGIIAAAHWESGTSASFIKVVIYARLIFPEFHGRLRFVRSTMKSQMRPLVDLRMACIRIPRGENCKSPPLDLSAA
jgi:hypothetical protein